MRHAQLVGILKLPNVYINAQGDHIMSELSSSETVEILTVQAAL